MAPSHGTLSSDECQEQSDSGADVFSTQHRILRWKPGWSYVTCRQTRSATRSLLVRCPLYHSYASFGPVDHMRLQSFRQFTVLPDCLSTRLPVSVLTLCCFWLWRPTVGETERFGPAGLWGDCDQLPGLDSWQEFNIVEGSFFSDTKRRQQCNVKDEKENSPVR